MKLSVQEAATLLGRSPRTIRAQLKRGDLPGEKRNGPDHAIVRLRVLLRLARDIGLVSAGGLRHASGRLRTIGRMVGGWRKRMKPSPPWLGELPEEEASGSELPPARIG